MNVTDAYFATVYFVDPAIICNGGRTEEEFAAQGTGDRLSLQGGPTSADLITVPLNESEILQDVRRLQSDVMGGVTSVCSKEYIVCMAVLP